MASSYNTGLQLIGSGGLLQGAELLVKSAYSAHVIVEAL